MPFVKILMNKTGIKLGITHNYKGTEYSLFMLYGELLGEEMMGSVKEYVIQCYEDLRAATSVDAISAEEVWCIFLRFKSKWLHLSWTF